MDQVKHLRLRGAWNKDLMYQLLPEKICKHVLNEINIEDSNNQDCAWWIKTSSGKFTVISAQELIRQRGFLKKE